MTQTVECCVRELAKH